LLLALLATAACSEGSSAAPEAKNPATATKAAIDRFSDGAGHLQKRSDTPSLPQPNQPVSFDQGPFITDGLGPTGQKVRYYNFDVQPTRPAPIYVLFKAGSATPISGQLNIIDVIPGDAGYNDFWQVHKVTVPGDYVANAVTSASEIAAAGYVVEPTSTLVNCPVVPEGSTATLRLGGEDAGLQTGWYRGQTVRYFSFTEKTLTADSGGVPLSPIYVSFNVNPGATGGGPGSGFKTEANSIQTHNVTSTIPSDPTYSPLWLVNLYDNASFPSVTNLTTALAAPSLVPGAAMVNCPIVDIR
jgi:hypothetical protein